MTTVVDPKREKKEALKVVDALRLAALALEEKAAALRENADKIEKIWMDA